MTTPGGADKPGAGAPDPNTLPSDFHGEAEIEVTRIDLPDWIEGEALSEAVRIIEDWQSVDDPDPIQLLIDLGPLMHRQE